MYRISIFFLLLIYAALGFAQIPVNTSGFKNVAGTKINNSKDKLEISWDAGGSQTAMMRLDLIKESPLFESIGLSNKNSMKEIAAGIDPAFVGHLLT